MAYMDLPVRYVEKSPRGVALQTQQCSAESLKEMKMLKRVVILLAISVMAFSACTGDEGEGDLRQAVIDNYAAGAFASYAKSLSTARELDVAVDSFLSSPSQVRLDAAKHAWLRARDDYGVTEIYRFYEGPIDNEENGPEGLINAWPLDESYIDYVDGDASAGIVNRPGEFPVIDADLLVSLNEEGGEENISTGWHAIEFLLWGQDLNADGPGYRPVEDYTVNENADRRRAYLSVASDLLLTHLQDMVDAWAPGTNNYRSQFASKDTDEALTDIITGIGEMSRGELAGERMTVAYEERSQEDEHSCFADNTNADIIANALGVQRVYFGDYGDVSGPGVMDLVASEDEELAETLGSEIKRSVALAKAIPNPFDSVLAQDLADSDARRRAVLDTIVALEDQTDTIVAAAEAVGITISVT